MNCGDHVFFMPKLGMAYTGGKQVLEEKSVTITENGETTVVPSGEATALSSVRIMTNVDTIPIEIIQDILLRLNALEAWENGFSAMTSEEIDEIIAGIS